MKIGLYFGTFNPIHVGHLIIANYFANETDLDQVWLVVSPHNPLKDKATLLNDFHRLDMVKEAIEYNPKLKASDIEFKLAQPSYTATTLAYLKENYPNEEFSLIMGEDSLRSLNKWYNYEVILKNHKILVYPRAILMEEFASSNIAIEESVMEHPNVRIMKDVPIMKISASYIRKTIKNGKDFRYLVTEPVFKYIEEMHFYR
jgi:nicotinate-nucleotide adenylyltransferase